MIHRTRLLKYVVQRHHAKLRRKRSALIGCAQIDQIKRARIARQERVKVCRLRGRGNNHGGGFLTVDGA